MVRYELDTCTRHFGKFGTTSIPVPGTSVGSVRPQYPVPDTSVSSVCPPKIPRVPVHLTRHRTYPWVIRQRQSPWVAFPTDFEANSTNHPRSALYARRRVQRQANDARSIFPIQNNHRLPKPKNNYLVLEAPSKLHEPSKTSGTKQSGDQCEAVLAVACGFESWGLCVACSCSDSYPVYHHVGKPRTRGHKHS